MHLGVEYWLDQLKLSQYLPLFRQFHDVQELLFLDEAALKNEIGIKNGGHRATIMTSLVMLRSKYNKRQTRETTNSKQAAPSASRSLSIEHPASHDVWSRHSGGFGQLSAQLSSRPQWSASVLNITRMPDLDKSSDLTETESLRRQLEWELSLDETRLESHAWYHGPIPRPHAESLLKNDGEFLIRDSSSGQGDLVLSTFWRGGYLHFIIAKVIIQPNTVYASIHYRLEDEPFETVPNLVRYYVGSGKALTVASGAKITTPINRSQPLSLYSSRYGASGIYQQLKSPSLAGQNVYSGSATLGRTRMVHPTSMVYSTGSLPRPGQMRRHPSEPALDEGAANPPPKPSRVPSIRRPELMRADNTKFVKSSSLNKENYVAETDEIDGEAGDVVSQLPVQATTLPRLRKINKGNRPISDTRDSFLDSSNKEVEHAEPLYSNMEMKGVQQLQRLDPSGDKSFPSLFNLQNFKTLLLPPDENLPLEIRALEEISLLFESSSPKATALHLLHNDVDIFGGFGNPVPENVRFCYLEYFKSRGLSCGLDLCTLPVGKQYRKDLLERTNCMRLFVAFCILSCATAEDQCAMLNMWIEIAIESKTALGNMYGYLNIMSGLCMPQIQRLATTWNMLRQLHTHNAYTFETRLRPHKKSEVTQHPPNTTVPDLSSAILLWEASVDSFLNEDGHSLPRLNVHLTNTGSDFGLDCFASHLITLRSWSLNLPLYLRNSRKALEQFQFNELLLDIFKTEFQMKILWGSRGVSSTADARYDKFEQVLSALSERCEPSPV